jgi:hypothetical protein
MTGAPVSDGVAGSFKEVLKACLILGFNQQAVSSLTVDANGLATVTTVSPHGFPAYSIVRIEGADQAALNNDWTVTATDTNTFQFQTSESSVTATGTINARFAPVPDWAIEAEDGNNIAFKSLNFLASGKTFVIEDVSDTIGVSSHRKNWGYLSAVENFVDFTTTKIARGVFWTLLFDAPPRTQKWWVFADSRFVMFAIHPASDVSFIGNNYGTDAYINLHMFGDIDSFRNNHTDDVIVLSGQVAKSTIDDDNFDADAQPSRFSQLNSSVSKSFVRSFDGISTNVALTMLGFYTIWTGHAGFAFPEPGTGKAIISDITCMEALIMRGFLPGAKQFCHNNTYNANGSIVEHDGKAYFALKIGKGTNGAFGASLVSGAGEVWIDITGPWR